MAVVDISHASAKRAEGPPPVEVAAPTRRNPWRWARCAAGAEHAGGAEGPSKGFAPLGAPEQCRSVRGVRVERSQHWMGHLDGRSRALLVGQTYGKRHFALVLGSRSSAEKRPGSDPYHALPARRLTAARDELSLRQRNQPISASRFVTRAEAPKDHRRAPHPSVPWTTSECPRRLS